MNEHEGWIQDPDGNWHPAPRPRISGGGWFVIFVVVAALIGGGFYWNWKQDQDRIDGEIRDFTCQISGRC